MFCFSPQRNASNIFLPVVAFVFFASVVSAAASRPDDKPVYSAYKGVSVGMKVEDARKVLGKPTDQSDTMDMYVFSDKEVAQVYYDAGLVKAISITYSGNLNSAPTPKDILGEAIAPKPDGGIFKMIRYPKAGFWVSYNKTAGDDPIINISMQKI